QKVGPGSAELTMKNPAWVILGRAPSAKERLAADWLIWEINTLAGGNKVALLADLDQKAGSQVFRFYIVDWSKPGIGEDVSRLMDEEDRALLADPEKTGQSYVLKVDSGNRVVGLVGCEPQGALYAVATLVQLMTSVTGGVSIKESYIRDYPDFKYRAAAD